VSAVVRRALVALTLLSSVGIAIELVLSRHWTEPSQLIAWAALALVVAAGVAVLGTPNSPTIRVIRLGLLLVVGASLIGVVLHAHGNYQSGPLDAVYGDRWATMGSLERWWLAVREQVGPAPVIVPLALAQLAALAAIATIGLGGAGGSAGSSGSSDGSVPMDETAMSHAGS
jgi:hypothetical protein